MHSLRDRGESSCGGGCWEPKHRGEIKLSCGGESHCGGDCVRNYKQVETEKIGPSFCIKFSPHSVQNRPEKIEFIPNPMKISPKKAINDGFHTKSDGFHTIFLPMSSRILPPVETTVPAKISAVIHQF